MAKRRFFYSRDSTHTLSQLSPKLKELIIADAKKHVKHAKIPLRTGLKFLLTIEKESMSEERYRIIEEKIKNTYYVTVAVYTDDLKIDQDVSGRYLYFYDIRKKKWDRQGSRYLDY